MTTFLNITAYHLNLLGLLSLIFDSKDKKMLFKQFPTLFLLTMDCSETISLSFFLQAPLYVNTTSVLTCPPGKIVLRVSPRN